MYNKIRVLNIRKSFSQTNSNQKKEHKKKKSHKKKAFKIQCILSKEIILLLITILIVYTILEISFKVYYAVTNREVGVNNDEVCMKEYYNRLFDNKSFQDFRIIGYYDIHPVIGLTLKPGFVSDKISLANKTGENKKFVVYDLHHNSQGMRSLIEYSITKPEDVDLRIAMFGDSFTYGHDVPLKSGMSSLLQAMIPHTEVLNFGVPGRGTDTMYLRYALEGRKFSPDIIIFNVYIEDLVRYYDTCIVDRPNLIVKNGRITIAERKYPAPKEFYESYTKPRFESYFLKHMVYSIGNINKNERDMKNGLELFSIMLDDLKEKNSQDGSYFMVGILMQENPPKLVKQYYEKLKKVLEEKGIPYFDSADYFELQKEQYKAQSFYYIDKFRPSGHFSPIGNGVYALGLKKKLVEAGLVSDQTEYYFTNFNLNSPVLMINKKFNENVLAVLPYGIENESYENVFFPPKVY